MPTGNASVRKCSDTEMTPGLLLLFGRRQATPAMLLSNAVPMLQDLREKGKFRHADSGRYPRLEIWDSDLDYFNMLCSGW